jgi:hypothetical protein
MALKAAEIGERVFTGQVLVALYQGEHKELAEDDENGNYRSTVGIIVDVLHWASANGFDPHSVLDDADVRYRRETAAR